MPQGWRNHFPIREENKNNEKRRQAVAAGTFSVALQHMLENCIQNRRRNRVGGKKSGSWRASDAAAAADAAWTAVIGMPKYVLWATCGRQMFSSYPAHTPACCLAPCHGLPATVSPPSATLDVKQFVSEIKQTIKPIKRDTRSTVFSQ